VPIQSCRGISEPLLTKATVKTREARRLQPATETRITHSMDSSTMLNFLHKMDESWMHSDANHVMTLRPLSALSAADQAHVGTASISDDDTENGGVHQTLVEELQTEIRSLG